MAAKVPVWGIDVGQCALKAVKVQAAGDEMELLELDVVEHESLLSQPESDAPSLIRKSLETLLSKHDLRRERVVVAVPGQQTLTRFAKLPPVEPKKIPDMVNYEAQQQIPFDMDEVAWDYEVFSQPDSPDIEIGIFAIRKELIRNHLTYFTSLGIEPVIVQSAPLASYNAIRWDGQIGEETTVLLDMGAVSTDLIVVEGNSIWSRPVPLGGNHFTESLVKAFKLSFAKAEQLKRTAATSKYSRQIFQAMRPVFADLVSEVQRSIGFYSSTHRQSEIKRVLGMGGGFALPGLQKFLQQSLQLKVDKFEGFKKIAKGGAAKSPEYAASVLSLPVSVGTALQELFPTAVRSNLLPADAARQQMWRKKRPWFVASAACIAGSAAAVWLGNVMATSALASKIGDVRGAVPCAAVDKADQILSTPRNPSEPPVEYAAKVLGALDKLSAEYKQLPRIEDQKSQLDTISQLPASNTVIPQMFDVIHRTFRDAIPPEVRGVKSVEEYLALAGKMPRSDRSEVYIDRLVWKFDARDALKSFTASGAREAPGEGEAAETAQGGWGIAVFGHTTRKNSAAWLEEIAAKLKVEGRKAGRGFWIDSAEVRNISKAGTKGATGRGGNVTLAPPAPGASGRPGLPGVGSRDEDRSAGPAPRGFGSGAGAPGGAAAGSDADVRRQLEELKPKPGVDPVTEETATDDETFTMVLVVRKGNTPPDKLPKGEKDKASPGTPAPEPPPPTESTRD